MDKNLAELLDKLSKLDRYRIVGFKSIGGPYNRIEIENDIKSEKGRYVRFEDLENIINELNKK